jgi:hypothetical protein
VVAAEPEKRSVDTARVFQTLVAACAALNLGTFVWSFFEPHYLSPAMRAVLELATLEAVFVFPPPWCGGFSWRYIW